MGIQIKYDNPQKLAAAFEGVELNALQYVQSKWGFKDESAVLQFALAILFKAEGNYVEFKDEHGKKQKLSPAEALMNPAGQG